MIFSENRYPLFRIMLYGDSTRCRRSLQDRRGRSVTDCLHHFIPDRPMAGRPAVNRKIQVRVLVGEPICGGRLTAQDPRFSAGRIGVRIPVAAPVRRRTPPFCEMNTRSPPIAARAPAGCAPRGMHGEDEAWSVTSDDTRGLSSAGGFSASGVRISSSLSAGNVGVGRDRA